ncbi:MAG: hypothetical protein A3F78_03930 [Burkholderiales bacterium RIFCSPLOWO2_12_FULL_61_40]|nr:MAG: hypothetical protein A3F78_03930 [Burkholderiales bacterium RIFCSPLOWO2_12_FULL_61_40]
MILTISRLQAPPLPESGCWWASNLDFMQPPLWRPRAEVEQDEGLLQPITYARSRARWCMLFK